MKEYDTLSQKQLASIKRDMRVSFEDATVRATHKVMAEFEQENNVTDRELMHQALNALEVMRPACFAEPTLKKADAAITALRDRLAQELVIDCPRCGYCCPQQTWVGLTEIEIVDIEAQELTSASSETFSFARAIEYKLKEKNT